MSETGQDRVALEGRELISAVRQILAEHPERHDQQVWLGNAYLTPDELQESGDLAAPLDLIRPYAMRPLPPNPEDAEARWPVCGSTGCVAGWAAVLSAPPGSFIAGAKLILPGGDRREPLSDWAARKMGIGGEQAEYLFSPLRGRERLIRLLDALIEDPATELWSVP